MKLKTLTILFSLVCSGCGLLDMEGAKTEATLHLSYDSSMTRSADPDETMISDVNIFIFNKEGLLEERMYLESRQLFPGTNGISCRIRIGENLGYSVFACANLRYELKDITTIESLESHRYHMAYPDEYSKGMAMTGYIKDIGDIPDGHLELPLARMMSRISLRIDRNRLSSGVKFIVSSVKIGNCPRSATLFGPSHTLGRHDVFSSGFSKSNAQVNPLNRESSPGISEEVSVYMLENMHGDLLEGTPDDENKVLDDSDVFAGICSYIEIRAEYDSPDYHSKPGEYLIYRFYLGEDRDNFDVERNCHYHFTIMPEDTGLIEDSWRVDKKGLTKH